MSHHSMFPYMYTPIYICIIVRVAQFNNKAKSFLTISVRLMSEQSTLRHSCLGVVNLETDENLRHHNS